MKQAMQRFASTLFNAPRSMSPPEQVRWVAGFVVFAPMALAMDSVWAAQHMAHAQWSVNAITLVFFIWMLRALTPEQRLLAVVFVPVGALGEYAFSIVFGLYEYRLHNVPVYVPLGHPILLGVGMVLANLPWVRQHAEPLRKGLLTLHVAVLTGVTLLLGDTVSGAFALFAVYIFRRRSFRLLYGLMGLIVLYIELLGTALGNWAWAPVSMGGWLHSTNPPYGAFIGYVAADVLVMKVGHRVARRWLPQLVMASP